MFIGMEKKLWKNEVIKIKNLKEEQIMKKRIKSLMLCLVLGFSLVLFLGIGCSTIPKKNIYGNPCKNIEEIEVYYDEKDIKRPYKTIDFIQAEDVANLLFTSPSKEDALRKAKIKAIKIDADALLIISFHKQGNSYSSTYNEHKITIKAGALKYLD